MWNRDGVDMGWVVCVGSECDGCGVGVWWVGARCELVVGRGLNVGWRVQQNGCGVGLCFCVGVGGGWGVGEDVGSRLWDWGRAVWVGQGCGVQK